MADWNREKRSLGHEAQVTGFRGPDARQTTFGQNYEAFLTTAIQSDLTISEAIMYAPMRQRNEMLDRMVREGQIDKDVVDTFRYTDTADPWTGEARTTRIDYGQLSEYVRENGIADVESDEEIDSQIREEIHFFQQQAQEISSRSGTMGTIGGFVGGLHAGVLDPVNILATLAIPGVGHGATVWRTAGRQAAAGAAGNLVAEAAIQPAIMQFKNDVGLEYTWSDALTNASLSAILGATIGGATGAAGKWHADASKRSADARRAGDLDSAEGNAAIAEGAQQLEVELRNAPDTTIDPATHDRNVVDRARDVDQRTPEAPEPVTVVDPEEFTQQFQVEPDSPTQASAATEVEIVRKKDGTPFKTEASAKAQAKRSGLEGYEPTQTENGWVLARRAEEEPTVRVDEPETPAARTQESEEPRINEDPEVLAFVDEDGRTFKQVLDASDELQGKMAVAMTCFKGN